MKCNFANCTLKDTIYVKTPLCSENDIKSGESKQYEFKDNNPIQCMVNLFITYPFTYLTKVYI